MYRNTLLLMLLLLVLVLVPDLSAFAQDAAVSHFPDKGPYTEHWIYEVLGFERGFTFFKMAAGRLDNSTLSLYYLALTMGMIGLLLIVLNKKFQEPATIGAWFLITFIMLIGPYGSKLFFYPLEERSANNEEIKAFTPQIIAIHLTNVLHRAIHDVLFSCQRASNGQASCNVRNSVADITNIPDLSGIPANVRKITDQPTLSMVHFYVGLGCGPVGDLALAPYHMYNNSSTYSVKPILYKDMDSSSCAEDMYTNINILSPGFTGEERTCVPSPEEYVKNSPKFDFQRFMSTLDSFYLAEHHKHQMSPPYAETFASNVDPSNSCETEPPAELSEAEKEKYNFSEEEETAWKAGYQNICALGDRLDEAGRHRQEGANAPKFPEFYLAQPDKIADGRETYAYDARHRTTMLGRLGPNISENGGTVLYDPAVTFLTDSYENSSLQSMPIKIAFVAPKPKRGSVREFLLVNGTSPSERDLTLWGYNDNPADSYSSGFSAIGGDEIEGAAGNCAQLHARLHERALLALFAKLHVPITQAVAMITGGGVQPWFYENLSGTNAQGVIGRRTRAIVQDLQNRGNAHNAELADAEEGTIFPYEMTTAINDGDSPDRNTSEAIGRYLAQRPELSSYLRLQINSDLLHSALSVSPEAIGVANATMGAQTDDSIATSQSDIVGQNFASGILSGLGDAVAQIGVMVTSWFATALVPIYIKFLLLIIKIAVMSLLLLTPLLLLMGMVVPGYAPGVLILAIGGVFILKFVPITFTIIDAILTQVMEIIRGANLINNNPVGGGATLTVVAAGLAFVPLIGLPLAIGVGGAGLSMVADQMLERSLVAHAAALLYTSSVGVTLFLLFKVGDPSVLQNLTQLDTISKDIADKGIKAVPKVAMAAATSSVAAAGGFMGGGVISGASKGLQSLAKEGLKELGIDGAADGLVKTYADARASGQSDASYREDGRTPLIEGLTGTFRDAEAEASARESAKIERGGLTKNKHSTASMLGKRIKDQNMSEEEADAPAKRLDAFGSHGAQWEAHSGAAERGSIDIDTLKRMFDRGTSLEKMAILAEVTGVSVENLQSSDAAMNNALLKAESDGFISLKKDESGKLIDQDGAYAIAGFEEAGVERLKTKSAANRIEEARAQARLNNVDIAENSTAAYDHFTTEPFSGGGEKLAAGHHERAEQWLRNQAAATDHSGEKESLTKLADLMKEKRENGGSFKINPNNKYEHLEKEAQMSDIVSGLEGAGGQISQEAAETTGGQRRLRQARAQGFTVLQNVDKNGKSAGFSIYGEGYLRKGSLRAAQDSKGLRMTAIQRGENPYRDDPPRGGGGAPRGGGGAPRGGGGAPSGGGGAPSGGGTGGGTGGRGSSNGGAPSGDNTGLTRMGNVNKEIKKAFEEGSSSAAHKMGSALRDALRTGVEIKGSPVEARSQSIKPKKDSDEPIKPPSTDGNKD